MTDEAATAATRPDISVIVPARDEAEGLATLLPELRQRFPQAEILVVDDASIDGTPDLCVRFGARCLSAPYPTGNGAAVKRGARAATGRTLVLLDGDGQHRPEDAARLLEHLREGGYDMMVGARSRKAQASWGRMLANTLYNWLASRMTGHRIRDLTSGLRVVDAQKFREFLHLLPNGFSYPTTITMAFFRSGYAVGYLPVEVLPRKGASHIRPGRDGLRCLVIIFKIGALYSPLKAFLPVSLLTFLSGFGLYGYTFFTEGRFTNMSALLISTSLLVFLIGLVSEQITSLMFSRHSD